MFQINLLQPTKGYRYNLDSLLLCKFAQFKKNERVCDLGCGVGILGILAMCWGQAAFVAAFEVQQELFEYAQKNVLAMNFDNPFDVYLDNWKNVKKYLKAQSFDLVISNPPYRKRGSGNLSQHSQKIIAKHEIEGSLKDLLQSAKYLMKRQGRFCVTYPTVRLEEFIEELAKHKLKISRLQMLHPFAEKPANNFMAEVRNSVRGEIIVEAPLVIFEREGIYTKSVQGWVGKSFDPK